MEKAEVIELMKTSKSNLEWNINCDIVHDKCGGYPAYWFTEMIVNELLLNVSKTWTTPSY